MRDGNGDFGERIVTPAGEIDGGEVEGLGAGGGRRAEVVYVDLKMRGRGGMNRKKMSVVATRGGHVRPLQAERSDAGSESRRRRQRRVLNGGHLEERVRMNHLDEDVGRLWDHDGLVHE